MDLFYSHGSAYLAYIGVDPSFPGWSDLARAMDDEFLFIAEQMVREQYPDDPELRISMDDRCVMWEWHDTPAGHLPPRTRIEISGWTGDIYQPTPYQLKHDAEWQRDDTVYYHLSPGYHASQHRPSVKKDTIVSARLPIPLDRGALLTIIDTEAGRPAHQPPDRPRRRTGGMSPAMAKLARQIGDEDRHHLTRQARNTWTLWIAYGHTRWENAGRVTRTARALDDAGYLELHPIEQHRYRLNLAGRTALAAIPESDPA